MTKLPGSRKNRGLVLRHGRTCSELRWAILWIGTWKDRAIAQSFNSLLGWSQLQEGGVETIGELQTIMSFDLFDSSYMWIQTMLSCGKHCYTMQIGTVSRLRFCRRSWGFKIYIRWNSVRLGSHTFVPISWMCKKQTFSFAQIDRIRNHFFGCRIEVGWYPLKLDLWDLIVAVLANTYQSHEAPGDLCPNQREVRSTPHTLQKRKKSHGTTNDLDNVGFIPSNVNSSRQKPLLYVFEDKEAVINPTIKGRSQTLKHVSRPTELLLIGCLIESIWTPKSKSNTLTPRTNSKTYWQREISHAMNRINPRSRPTTVTWILPNVLKWCQKEHQKMQVKKESQQNRSRWWIWSRDAAKGILTCLLLLHQKARGKPDMKFKTSELVDWAASKKRWDLSRTLTHQATQSGMLTKNGLLKSGNLIEWLK